MLRILWTQFLIEILLKKNKQNCMKWKKIEIKLINIDLKCNEK